MATTERESPRPELPLRATGGCHCGAVRFTVTLRSYRMSECNCSMCTRKGFLHLIVPKSDFTLEAGADALGTYTFNTGTAKHHFCSRCGVHSFYVPRSHPDGYSVNARCLDAIDLGWFELVHFDGQNWEAQIANYPG